MKCIGVEDFVSGSVDAVRGTVDLVLIWGIFAVDQAVWDVFAFRVRVGQAGSFVLTLSGGSNGGKGLEGDFAAVVVSVVHADGPFAGSCSTALLCAWIGENFLSS